MNRNLSLRTGVHECQNKSAPHGIAYIFYILIALFILSPSISGAQTPPSPTNKVASTATIKTDVANKEIDKKNVFFSKSLFFSKEEVSAIQRALLGVNTPDEDDGKPKAPRVLRLSGLLYQSSDNWVIWLNGNRVTPERLLPEIIDINVAPMKIHLKWFDYAINDVISITLRPHQVYDIATGILLPG